MPCADNRLAVYGTLALGQKNHDQLDALDGVWSQGTVRGILVDKGWGATLGHPGIILDSNGPAVEVQLFASADLPKHWKRLDAFEGNGYRRSLTMVSTIAGKIEAHIYELANTSDCVEPIA